MRIFYTVFCLVAIVLFTSAGTYGQYNNGFMGFGGNDNAGQLGLSVKLISAQPLSSFGATYKKTVGVDVGVVINHWDGWLKQRAGFYHVSFAPRLDSFPIFTDFNNGSGYKIYDGKAVWSNMSITSIYIDESFRFFKIQNFSMHGGLGFMIGIASYKYLEVFNNGGGGEDITTLETIVGVRNHLSADYTINNRFRVSAEFMNIITSNKDWSLKTPHNNLSIGCTFYFRELDE